MVESALEFARIARDLGYHHFVFSMKSSNPKVMIEAYRLLVARLAQLDGELRAEGRQSAGGEAAERPKSSEDRHAGYCVQRSDGDLPSWNYPIHLGVTEAGDGEDGRIKSAIGIGSLLSDGIGDTIRVSLTEDSVHEIPVAKSLIDLVLSAVRSVNEETAGRRRAANVRAMPLPTWDPFSYERRATESIERAGVKIGGEELVKVAITRDKFGALEHKIDRLGEYRPDFICEDANVIEIDPRDEAAVARINASTGPQLVTVRDDPALPPITGFRLLAARLDRRHPILLKDTQFTIGHPRFLDALLTAATNLGSLLCDGIGDAILVRGEESPGQSLRLAFNVLQAAGARIFKTDYVACPSCGRTLFNLQQTTGRIKAATSHLKGVKIAVMGCIVNGPGEMADADFGYVGGAPGKINLYVGRSAVKFNIPEEEAVERLVDLIREHGKWIEAPLTTASAVA
jgi:(E)-4-hydroxy-3-methylbut-2-enyl-diphosphate synthase